MLRFNHTDTVQLRRGQLLAISLQVYIIILICVDYKAAYQVLQASKGEFSGENRSVPKRSMFP